ncbi:MAG: DegT/DnrJ/EryC1/StrS aminotransferase family protein [Vicinamibacterales bacterium]
MSTSEDFLPFCRPSIGEEEIAEVVDTLRSVWLTTGPKTHAFERAFGAYTGASHSVALNSCTAGLHLALLAAGVTEGDEVILPSLTFCATANVVVHRRATPVFAEIDEASYTLDPASFEQRITPRTKAVIPVHHGGQVCDMRRINEVAREHGITVIEDAAHAAGAKLDDVPVGNISAFTSFSFYATKNLTTGEGGMLTTNDPSAAERIRVLALHGISADAWKRYAKEGSWYYEVLEPGYKYNMTDIQASIGLHQLAKLEAFVAQRAQLATRYTTAFGDLPEVITPIVRPGVRHAWHLYPIRVRTGRLRIDRAGFVAELANRGIGASVHFIPVHLHPFYRDTFGCRRGDLPITERVYDEFVSLPLFPSMTAAEADRVIAAVRGIVADYRA